MNILDMLGNFIEPFIQLLPQIARRPTSIEYMVVDCPLGVSERRWPRLYCPALTQVEYLPRYEYPLDCGIQKLTTGGGDPVIVNATLLISIDNPVQLRTRASGDWENAIALVARAEVCEIVSKAKSVGDIVSHRVSQKFSDDMADFGLKIARFKVEDVQKVIPVSITN